MNRPTKNQSFVSWFNVPLLFLALCVAGALTGGCLTALTGRLISSSGPDFRHSVLSVPPDMLDFGEAWVQPDFAWTLPVTNTSSHPVEVAKIVTSCSCTSVEPEAFVVDVGETVPVHLTLDLRKQAPEGGEPMRRFEVTIAAVVADSDSRIEWSLSGVTKSRIEVTPGSIALGRWSEREQPTPRVLRVSLLQPTSTLTAECPCEFVDVSVTIGDQPIGNADEYELQMLAKSASVGSIDSELQLHAIAADGSPFPAYRIPVNGQVVRDVQPIRPSETLGVLTAGSRFQTRVELRSLTDSEFEVLTATCSGEGVQVQAEPGSSTVFNVSGVTNGLGMQDIDIQFTVRHTDGDSYPITVPIRYVAAEG